MKKKRELKKKIASKEKNFKNLKIFFVCIVISAILIGAFTINNFKNQDEFYSQLIVKIASPLNKTYNTSKIPVAVTVSDVPLWISSSVDGGPVVRECERCTFYSRYDFNFKPGQHTITIYASDRDNKVSMVDVKFTVELPE